MVTKTFKFLIGDIKTFFLKKSFNVSFWKIDFFVIIFSNFRDVVPFFLKKKDITFYVFLIGIFNKDIL